LKPKELVFEGFSRISRFAPSIELSTSPFSGMTSAMVTDRMAVRFDPDLRISRRHAFVATGT
jgi:hypothetical protein